MNATQQRITFVNLHQVGTEWSNPTDASTPAPAHRVGNSRCAAVRSELTVLMLSTFRRHAAVLASYLAQFDTADTDCPNARDAGGTALTEREKEQYRRDYHQAADWATATEITDDDIAALARMRRRHGFPTR